MTDAPQIIARYNAGRDPERLALKLGKMRQDSFVFLRGSCHLFYQRLARDAILDAAPRTWVCGDLHLENFGSFKGDNRLVYFDVNDFDEAALAPCTWDLVRFLTSVRVGAASLGLKTDGADALCRRFVEAYAQALAEGKARWVERDTAEGLVGELLDRLKLRSRPRFLDSRTVLKGKARTIVADGRKALPATPEQRRQVEVFMESFARKRDDAAFFRVLDVARRIAGTGSLGVGRFIILVEGKGSPDGNYLLDLKQALPSSLPPHLDLPQPAWSAEAERVVGVQRRMQAVSMAFLQAVAFDGQSWVLRGLQPSEDRVDLAGQGGKRHRLEEVLAAMGRIVAWAQLRSGGRDGSAIADELIDFGRREDWRAPLLAWSSESAERVAADWKRYAEAYDDGFFGR